MLKVKRVYEKKDGSDGRRIYVDRLWPRGLSKREAEIDEWMKDLSPSADLRKWFGHEPAKFEEFKRRYRKELEAAESKARLRQIATMSEREDVTLLYSARDTEHNNAVVLAELVGALMRNSTARG